MDIERVAIGSVRMDAGNVRTHSKRNLETIKRSLEAFGQQKPIVVGADGIVVAGNGTLDAALALGWTHIDVVRTELEGSARKAYAVADNRTAELAEWDDTGLAEYLAGLKADTSFDETVTGFDAGEIERLIGAPEVVEDETPAVPETPVTRTGDLWLLGDHRVLCGDATKGADVKRLCDGVSPMLLTDPPYCSGGFQEAGKASGSVGTRGTERVANDTLSTRGYGALLKAVLGNVAAPLVHIFTDWRMWVNLFDVAESSGYGVRQMVVWDKGSPGMGRGWRSQHELILVASKVSQPFDPHRAQGNVIQCQRTGNVLHATEKPVELIGKILSVADIYSDVYDPFLGSGTTLIAAEQLGRKCLGIEIEPKYVDVTLKRWANLTGKQPIREADGKTFAELEGGSTPTPALT